MGSLYLNRLSAKERDVLVDKLNLSQKELCFICNEKIDLKLHRDSIDIDHIVPTKLGGKDDPINFALTHSSCNRSKQASDLNIARILHYFHQLREKVENENRGPNLGDILKINNGSKHEITFEKHDGRIRYSLPEIGKNQIVELPVYVDQLSGFEYFFTTLPIEYLFHDDKINPRSIGQNISKLIQEFYFKRPQLHISLSWVDLKNSKTKVRIFDGQHKALPKFCSGCAIFQ